MRITGQINDGFQSVGGILEQSVDAGHDLGASVAVVVGGETVLNIAAGHQDRAKTLPYTPETMAPVYSSGKAVCAALIAVAVSEGKLSYDQTVASLWPAFGAEGKDQITVAQALSHQAGLSGFTDAFDPKRWLDWEQTTTAIAAAKPLWEPGTASGYHPQTFGYIAGELLIRTMGKSVGQLIRRVTKDVVCGLSLSEATRVSPMVKPKRAPDLGAITPIKRAAFLEAWSSPSGVSRQEWAAAEIPASNMHATAHGLAEFMQLFAAGQFADLSISDATRSEAWAERISGEDLVLPYHLSWGAGVIRENGKIFGAPPTAIGHYGFGGSCVLADPAIGLSFAYVPNQQSPSLVADPRAVELIQAVYKAVA
ncbi:MAG: serine hydrolase domain-containing protein [Pseudomonadota bacterium]